MGTFTIKGVTFGEGPPKICVPLTGCTIEAIKVEIEQAAKVPIDLVEWRADCCQELLNESLLQEIALFFKATLPDCPLLFTFRTQSEGGEGDISWQEYEAIYHLVMALPEIDMLDIEYAGITHLPSIVEEAHRQEKKVILSYHNFNETPTTQLIQKKLMKMENHCGDIAKIAVMPRTKRDVSRFINAMSESQEQLAHTPIIGIAMGKMGKVTRVAGEMFDSAITFARLDQRSAPGQLSVSEVRDVQRLLTMCD